MSPEPDIIIKVWRCAGKWFAALEVGGAHERIDRRFESAQEAFDKASSLYDDAEAAMHDERECTYCDGTGEGMHSDTTCMHCNGLGVLK